MFIILHSLYWTRVTKHRTFRSERETEKVKRSPKSKWSSTTAIWCYNAVAVFLVIVVFVSKTGDQLRLNLQLDNRNQARLHWTRFGSDPKPPWYNMVIPHVYYVLNSIIHWFLFCYFLMVQPGRNKYWRRWIKDRLFPSCICVILYWGLRFLVFWIFYIFCSMSIGKNMLQKTEKIENASEPLKNSEPEPLYKLTREITVVRMTESNCIRPRRRRPTLKRQNAVEIPE